MTVLDLMEVLINYCPDTKVEVSRLIVNMNQIEETNARYNDETDTIEIIKYVPAKPNLNFLNDDDSLL